MKFVGRDPWNYPIYQLTCEKCGDSFFVNSRDLDKINHKCSKKEAVVKKQPEKRPPKILGKVYGNLKVISRLNNKSYLSECLLCGGERKISYNALTKGHEHNLHCGCLGSKKLRYPPTPEILPPIVWERIEKHLSLLHESKDYDSAYPELIRAAWITHCKDLKGEKYHLKNFLMAYIKFSCYNDNQSTINMFSHMTQNVSAYDVTAQPEQSGFKDRKIKKIKFQRR